MTLAKRSYKSHLRALYAIIKKELLIYSRYRSAMVYAVVCPLFVGLWHTAQYWMFTGPSRTSPTLFEKFTGTSNYIAFYFLGHVVVFYFAHTVWQVAYALRREQQTGTLESNFLCPTRPILLILGRALAFDITSAFSAVFIFLLGWWAVGLHFEAAKMQFVPLVIILVLAASFGFGLFFAGLVMLYRQVDAVVSFFVFLQYAFCGSNFAIAVLPAWLRAISYLMPATWGIEAVRGILIYNLGLAGIIHVTLILLGFASVLLLLGSLLFGKFERIVKRRGGLGAY